MKLINKEYDSNQIHIEAVDFPVRDFSNFDLLQFELAKDSYYGSGGFYTGKYLEKAPRENQKKYTYRVNNKKYTNFVRPVVNGLIDPVLYRDPVRKSAGEYPYFEPFENQPTLSEHTTLTNFVYSTGINGFLYGGDFVIMDNFPTEEIPNNEAEAIEQRKFPYVYNVNPTEVAKYSFDRFGRLRYLSYCVDTNQDGDVIRAHRFADEEDINTGYDGEVGDAITYLTDTAEARNPATVGQSYSMPYFFQISPQFDKRIYPISVIQPLADTSRNIFQINSLIHYQHTQLTFPILTYNGQKSEEMSLSEDSVLYYDEGMQKPDYIAPPRDTLEALYKDRENSKMEVYEMTHQAINTVSAQASGEARKQADKQRQEVLSFVEKRLIELEKWIIGAFYWYMDEEPDVAITYQSNLDGDGLLNDIAEAGDFLERIGLSQDNTVLIRKRLLRKLFSEMDDEEFNAVALAEDQNKDYGLPEEDEDDIEEIRTGS